MNKTDRKVRFTIGDPPIFVVTGYSWSPYKCELHYRCSACEQMKAVLLYQNPRVVRDDLAEVLQYKEEWIEPINWDDKRWRAPGKRPLWYLDDSEKTRIISRRLCSACASSAK